MDQQRKSPGCGNCRAMETVEKQTTVFPRFPQRLENSPKNVEFPTVPTAPTAKTNRNKNNQSRNKKPIVYTKCLTLPPLPVRRCHELDSCQSCRGYGIGKLS